MTDMEARDETSEHTVFLSSLKAFQSMTVLIIMLWKEKQIREIPT